MVIEEKTYTSADLISLLRKKYNTDNISNGNRETLLFEQVANSTGFGAGRWIDAAVFEMWPSHGFTRRAFEVKISRSDFLRELNNPEKYKWCFKYFHEFWYVAPKNVIQIEELPAGAGFLYPAGSRLNTGRQATHNQNPEMNDAFLCSCLRSSDKEIEAYSKRDKRELLTNDEGYKRAKMFESAVDKFVEMRLPPLYREHKTQDEILKTLLECSLDREVEKEKEHLIAIADKFQTDVANLFNLFALLASKSILARDEAGKLIFERWGQADVVDSGTLSKLKNDRYTDRYNAILENIRAWEKINKV